MKTKVIELDGVKLVVRQGYVPPCDKLKDFPNCCGAGKGWGEKIIPDKLFGLRISAACHIHDDCFKHGAATWEDFHQSSSMMIRNLLAIVTTKSMRLVGFFRVLLASVYFFAVDTVGSKVYTALKKTQGYLMRGTDEEA